MRRHWVVAGLLLFGAGCNRQDAECLGRIGNLVGQRLEKLRPNGTPGTDAGLGRTTPTNDGAADKSDADAAK